MEACGAIFMGFSLDEVERKAASPPDFRQARIERPAMNTYRRLIIGFLAAPALVLAAPLLAQDRELRGNNEQAVCIRPPAEHLFAFKNQPDTAELQQKLKALSGAARIRVLMPGMPTSMEYDRYRLNILIDKQSRFLNAWCG